MTEQGPENMTNEPLDATELPLTDEQTEATPSTENTENTETTVETSPEEQLKAQLEEVNDKYIRLLAEFDNFKRRTAKERIELFKVANAETLKSMITVLDDFDRAQKSMDTANDIDALKEGLKLVHHKLKTTLQSQGLAEMENSIGKTFDTDLHEAVTNIPAAEDMKGKVVDELEKGYLLNEKVIRFAKVVVGA
jgi:molecular chaperone GrpE